MGVCFFLCGPVLNWPLVQVVTLTLVYDSWERLTPRPAQVQEEASIDKSQSFLRMSPSCGAAIAGVFTSGMSHKHRWMQAPVAL